MPETVFAARLRELRNARGLSQPELAKQSGVGRSSITNWESGDSEPLLSAIRALATFFGCTADYLIGLTGHPQAVAPGHFLVDLDTFEAVRDGKPVGMGQRWYAVVPPRFVIVPPHEYARMDAALPERFRKKE